MSHTTEIHSHHPFIECAGRPDQDHHTSWQHLQKPTPWTEPVPAPEMVREERCPSLQITIAISSFATSSWEVPIRQA